MTPAQKMVIELRGSLAKIHKDMSHYGLPKYRIDVHQIIDTLRELQDATYQIERELSNEYSAQVSHGTKR